MARGFKTGGRTKGTPNKASVAGRDIALQWGPDALRKLAHLAGLIKDPEGNPIGMAESEEVQRSSCATILDRAYGKPMQPTVDMSDDEEIKKVLRVEFVDPPTKAKMN